MRKPLLLLALFAVTTPWAALAAPFCVQIRGVAPDCVYFDAGQCRKRAQQLSAICVANPTELKLPSGVGKYCLVDSALHSDCIYPDRGTCNSEANRHDNTACLDSTAPSVQPDPYRTDPLNRN